MSEWIFVWEWKLIMTNCNNIYIKCSSNIQIRPAFFLNTFPPDILAPPTFPPLATPLVLEPPCFDLPNLTMSLRCPSKLECSLLVPCLGNFLSSLLSFPLLGLGADLSLGRCLSIRLFKPIFSLPSPLLVINVSITIINSVVIFLPPVPNLQSMSDVAFHD